MLTLISGINKAYRGEIKIFGKKIDKYTIKELFDHNLAVLPQDPQALFVKKTVLEDLYEIFTDRDIPKDIQEESLNEIVEITEIENLLVRHPFDLSGGEQQRCALAKVLLLQPKLLLLDEPTKGIDNYFKEKLSNILHKLTCRGVTVLMISHDIEFCAKYADICSMFFNGNVVTTNTPNRFFSGNSFYTTSANRMSRHLFYNAVTNEDVIRLCNKNIEECQGDKCEEECDGPTEDSLKGVI